MTTVCGHRGAMGVAPENTIASFHRAVRDGAGEIELDIRISRDGAMVVIHDATVDRTTTGSGRVDELTLAQLRDLDAGDGERIPTLAEVLQAVDLPIQVEIKCAEAADELAALLRTQPQLRDRLSPTSFHAGWIEPLAREFPEIAVGLISATAGPDVLRQAADIGARRVFLGWSGTDAPLIERAHDLGLHYGLWPVNEPVEFSRAAGLPTDAITTNFPARYDRSAR